MARPKRYGPKTLAEDAGLNPEREPAQVMPEVKVSYREWKGKPSTCTPEITKVMAELLVAGLSIPVAAKAIGLPKGTWDDWNRYGKRDTARGVDSPYARWWDALEEAKASCEANLVRMVCAGAVHDWKAAAWLLERRIPERWQPADKRPNRGNTDDLSGKSAAELHKLLQDLREGKALPASTDSGDSGDSDEPEDWDDKPPAIDVESTAVDVE